MVSEVEENQKRIKALRKEILSIPRVKSQFSAFKCIACSERNVKRIDTRHFDDRTKFRRRYKCLVCGVRWTTEEKLYVYCSDIYIIQKDYSLQLFDLERLKRSIRLACKGRISIDESRISRIATDIHRSIDKQTVHAVKVSSSVLRDLCMDSLREMDPEVSFIRYCSMHNSFVSLNDWLSVINSVSRKE